MTPQYTKLKALLQELFQLDQPDLDFGLYRVMHAKRDEVTQFLDKDLLPQVQAAFGQYQTADKVELEQQLAKAIEQAHSLGADPETLPKVKELRARLTTDAVDVKALEREVYDHLYSFFRRYYSEGDFLAKRVYKPGVYAIPYEGEEVTLHWANKDQYYIKTSEYLRDYAFRLRPDDEANPMRVHFRLVDAAEGEHGNVKAAEGKERRFRLAADQPLALEDGELAIRFTYLPDARKQPELNAEAEAGVLGSTDAQFAEWVAALKALAPTEKDAARTLLMKHLKGYFDRNTFDYFIHKDLSGFLRRELDFYIKNEVMHLDDVESDTAPRVEQYLSKIKVVRRIAGKIIDFLAQLEDFQKKLWLKKKFVVETSYCIRLGIIPEEFYPEIAANEAQREEWVRLCAIDGIAGDLIAFAYTKPLTLAFLKAHPSLVLDTRFFSQPAVEKLLDLLDLRDRGVDGCLFASENFQALTFMRAQFMSGMKCAYVDPPYNTDASAINYKNNYKNSSWLSLVEDRLVATQALLKQSGIVAFAIDDEELSEARQVLGAVFPKRVGVAVVRSNPQSRKASDSFSPAHEYALFYGNGRDAVPGSLELTDRRLARYPLVDEKGRFSWMSFIRTGTNDLRADRPKMHYPMFVGPDDSIRIPIMRWDDAARAYAILEPLGNGEVAVFPVVLAGEAVVEKRWHRGFERVAAELDEYRVRRDSSGRVMIDFKTRIDEDSTPSSWWDKNEYASSNYGAAELKELFGSKPFAFPKSVQLVADCISASNLGPHDSVLDPFAGSGTTAHAVINLNRADGYRRTFVLVEMGDYFDTVLLPRIKKVIYTPKWKDGKPERLATVEESERSPRIVKVIRLESYEDALNNLEPRRTTQQQLALDAPDAQGADRLKEQYLLRYMLNVETRGSQSLLNVQAFTDPTAYKLKVKRPGSDESREVNVDLLETFNWLLGLRVQHIAAPQVFSASFVRDSEERLQLADKRIREDATGPFWFRTVTGTTPDGRTTLVIWRKLTGTPEQDNLVLDAWFTKQGYSARDSEFDLIYVNGGNNLENLKTADDRWKVQLTEEHFHRLMFEGTD